MKKTILAPMAIPQNANQRWSLDFVSERFCQIWHQSGVWEPLAAAEAV